MKANKAVFAEVAAIVKLKWLELGSPTGHCAGFAVLTQQLLKERGVQADIIVGSAGFSVTDEMNDALIWDKRANKSAMTPGAEHHLWVRANGMFFDTSAMSFDSTLREMSAFDGWVTNGTWGKDYNLIPVAEALKDEKRFISGKYKAGALYYRAAQVNPVIKTSALLESWIAKEVA